MIERLARTLGAAGLDLDAAQLADALWLATKMSAAVATTPIVPSEPEPPPTIGPQKNAASDPRQVDVDIGTKPGSADVPRVPDQPIEPPPIATPRTRATPVRVATATALPNTLGLGRAVRPYRRRIPSAQRRELDEVRTADLMAGLRLARRAVWWPVLRPVNVRWLELVLVVDDWHTTALWRDTVSQLLQVFSRSGCFRDVRVWRLSPADPKAPRLWPGLGEPGDRPGRPGRELLDNRNRRVLLIASDCVGPAWRSGAAFDLLARWARRAPVALLQLLAPMLWSRTAVGRVPSVPVLSRGEPGAPNARLVAPTWDRDDVRDRIPVPVLPLDADALKLWATLVSGRRSREIDAIWLLPKANPDAPPEPLRDEPEELLSWFRKIASPQAQRLARLLAVAPLSLAIMRLITQIGFKEATRDHLAEILLSHLVKPATRNPSDPYQVDYDLDERVRERLLQSADLGDSFAVMQRVLEHVNARVGASVSFAALVEDGGATGAASRLGDSFMAATRSVLRQLRHAAPPPPETPPTWSMEMEIVGRSQAMLDMLKRIETAAVTDAPVFVIGERGTGKTLVARALHARSSRRDRPFVAVNCALFRESAVEAELVGFERSFRDANKGTLVLDDVERLSPTAQMNLLGLILRREFDVRVISVSEMPLDEHVAGLLRQDLLSRLTAILEVIPPLRERRGDVPLLVEHFLRRFAPKGKVPTISARALATLDCYPFPGNVRELEQMILQAVAQANGAEIDLRHLPREVTADEAKKPVAAVPTSRTAAQAEFIARSPAMLDLLLRVESIAPTDSRVFLAGESGTGKELVARLLHAKSPRREQPFVALNCAAFPDALLEAELFGYERGAFSGAVVRRSGRFVAADKGTLLLDEVSELSPTAQGKLLRFIQTGAIEPLKSSQPVHVDVRVISASHASLQKRVTQGLFHKELYYALIMGAAQLQVPSLRERLGDIPLLVEHFLRRFAPAGQAPTISARALAALESYSFPGNVRELEHAILQAVVLANGEEVDLRHLPREVTTVQKEVRAEKATDDDTASPPTDAPADFVGGSPAMLELLARIRALAPTDANIVIGGESGTGKTVVARMLHQNSARRERPFVAMSCAAFPDSLLEAELFGYERGAFERAFVRRDGRVQAADKGTLFLDEVEELPLLAQPKLLRFLETGLFERLGSKESIHVDVRVISASHARLKERVTDGLFREDLYYRLTVVSVVVPPLRDRHGDIPLLVQHFLRRSAPNGKSPTISARALALLESYSFPGNVRELEHAIMQAVVLANGEEIDVSHLPREIGDRARDTRPSLPKSPPRQLTAVLVAGSGGDSDLSSVESLICQALGKQLARAGLVLVTGGWKGVDRAVGTSFLDELRRQGVRKRRSRLVQVVEAGTKPKVSGGTTVEVVKGTDIEEAVARADGGVLIGGLGGTLEVFQRMRGSNKPVIPIPATGGGARITYDRIRESVRADDADALARLARLASPIETPERAEDVAFLALELIERALGTHSDVRARVPMSWTGRWTRPELGIYDVLLELAPQPDAVGGWITETLVSTSDPKLTPLVGRPHGRQVRGHFHPNRREFYLYAAVDGVSREYRLRVSADLTSLKGETRSSDGERMISLDWTGRIEARPASKPERSPGRSGPVVDFVVPPPEVQIIEIDKDGQRSTEPLHTLPSEQRAAVMSAIRATGRISLVVEGRLEPVGTGFLVAPGLVATTPHVGTLVQNWRGEGPHATAVVELGGTTCLVEWLDHDEARQLAVLAVAPRPEVEPLALLVAKPAFPLEDRWVAVVWFPISTGSKRVQVAQILRTAPLQTGTEVVVDCSASLGNTAIVDLKTGSVVALQSRGEPGLAIHAMASWTLTHALRRPELPPEVERFLESPDWKDARAADLIRWLSETHDKSDLLRLAARVGLRDAELHDDTSRDLTGAVLHRAAEQRLLRSLVELAMREAGPERARELIELLSDSHVALRLELNRRRSIGPYHVRGGWHINDIWARAFGSSHPILEGVNVELRVWREPAREELDAWRHRLTVLSSFNDDTVVPMARFGDDDGLTYSATEAERDGELRLTHYVLGKVPLSPSLAAEAVMHAARACSVAQRKAIRLQISPDCLLVGTGRARVTDLDLAALLPAPASGDDPDVDQARGLVSCLAVALTCKLNPWPGPVPAPNGVPLALWCLYTRGMGWGGRRLPGPAQLERYLSQFAGGTIPTPLRTRLLYGASNERLARAALHQLFPWIEVVLTDKDSDIDLVLVSTSQVKHPSVRALLELGATVVQIEEQPGDSTRSGLHGTPIIHATTKPLPSRDAWQHVARELRRLVFGDGPDEAPAS